MSRDDEPPRGEEEAADIVEMFDRLAWELEGRAVFESERERIETISDLVSVVDEEAQRRKNNEPCGGCYAAEARETTALLKLEEAEMRISKLEQASFGGRPPRARQATGSFEQINAMNWGKGVAGLDHIRFFRRIVPDSVVAPCFSNWDGEPIAIADGSGRFPCDTDDGVVWLDVSGTIQIGSNASIPVLVLTDRGTWERSTAPMNPAHAVVVAGYFRMPIEARRENGQHHRVYVNCDLSPHRELR